MSTGYRFTLYYAGSQAYRRKGPPHPLLRLLGPLLILITIGVFLTGVLLLIDGPNASSMLRLLHKVTFILWLVVMGIHVLGHLLELPVALGLASRAERRMRRLPGSTGRGLAVAGSLVAGLVLALLFLPDVHAWTSAGVHHVHQINEH
jgi:hypothetical protein